MTLITSSDGTVHFSDLKKFARSAAHYKHSCETRTEPTRAMRIGTAIHHRVLGERSDRPLEVFPGDARRGKAWEEFAAARTMTEILTQPEWDDSRAPAEAVLADPVARTLLDGARFEVPLSWTENGMPMSTGGIDVVGPGYLAEIKSTANAEPEHFMRHAIKMLYHAQLAHYRMGMLSGTATDGAFDYHKNEYGRTERGLEIRPAKIDLYIIAVEVDAPYCVTVLTLSPEVIEAGERCVRAWLERLKVCADSDCWPGYAQSAVTWELPEWMAETEGFDE